jgi:hypothetical protein
MASCKQQVGVLQTPIDIQIIIECPFRVLEREDKRSNCLREIEIESGWLPKKLFT